MSVTGTVKNGVIVLPPGTKLPEGAEVKVETVQLERGSFTVPSLTYSVSRLNIALFYRGSSDFFGCSFNARHCPVTASELPVR